MKWVRYLMLACGLAILGLVLMSTYLGTHLVVSQRPEKADVIVVLGGDTADRAPIAAKLYAEGWAHRVLISGFPYECEENAAVLTKNGVAREDIIFDDKSTTTQTNGVNCSRIIRDLKMRRVILVTSWYHSARSLRIFKKYLPSDVAIVSVPSDPPKVWKKQDYQERNSEVLKSFRNWVLFEIPLV